ncbi:hypothetical protein [Nocardia miyunensis]|uniref:hypothetical protein n=1 Tax=Nocardia miyunensis TaxID=282684 RepID=UPI0008315F1E|nr:hypothetical protein [Nocardia miyunensis]
MKNVLAKFAFVAIAGAALAVPSVGIAAAQPTDWSGYNHPQAPGARNQHGDDWHCDRHGNWHNNERDAGGHRDGRCHVW